MTIEEVIKLRFEFDKLDNEISHGKTEVCPMTREYYEEVLRRATSSDK